MALAVADGTIALTTGAIGTTFTVSGLAFQPKALIFFWSGRATNGQAEGNHKFGMGLAVSTTSRRAMTTQSLHASTTSSSDRLLATDSCVATLTTAGAVDGKADLDAILSDGFRLIIDDVFSAALQVGWLALGGTDITVATIVDIAVPAAPGNQDITVAGFTASATDQAVIFLGSAGALDASAIHSCFCLGAAAGSALNNAVLAGLSVDAQATSLTASYCRAGESLARAFGEGVIDIRGSVTAWLTDGFRINWAEVISGEDFVALCLKGGQYAIGDALTSTGTTNQTEGTPFTPLALLVASHNKAASTQDTEQLVDERSVGVATGPTSRRYAGILDDDASASSDIGVAYDEIQMYANQSTAATIVIEGLMDLVSFDATPGFTYVMDDADPVAAFFWYLAMASAVAGGQTIAVGQVLETDLAQVIAWAPKIRLVGQVTETDLAQAITRVKTRALGQVLELAVAQSVTARKTRTVGQVTETDLAQGLTRVKTRQLGQVTETDLAQAITPAGPKIVPVGQVLETDLAQGITRRKTKTIGLVTEADLAQAITRVKTRAVGQVLELDVARAIAWAPKHRLVGQVFELDLAQAVTWAPKLRLIGQVTETDLALAIAALAGGFSVAFIRLTALTGRASDLVALVGTPADLVSLRGAA